MIKFSKLLFISFIISVIISAISIFPNETSAQVIGPDIPAEYELLEPLPCVSGGGVSCPGGELSLKREVNFKEYVQYMYNLLIALASVAAVFMIVWGGFEYMTSVIPGVKADGIKKATNAIYGLVLILSSYLILRTIDPRLVEIPPTLVEPLTIEYDRKIIKGFFEALETEAQKYKINSVVAVKNREEAKSYEQSLLSEKEELLEQLDEAEKYGDESIINNIKAKLAAIDLKISGNRLNIIKGQTLAIINQAMTTLAANATENILSLSDQTLAPGTAATLRKNSLQTIAEASKDIFSVYSKAITTFNSQQSADSAKTLQDIIVTADDSLLKTAQLYVETYKSNKPKSIPDTEDAIVNILKFKNSFAIRDPIKDATKNDLLITLCREEMRTVRLDPNLCK